MNTRAEHFPTSLTRGRTIGAGLLVLLLTAAMVLAVHYTPPPFVGPALTQLVVSGHLEHVSPQAVRAAVHATLGTGFFSTNVKSVRASIETLPWVEAASVRRSWPHTLYVDITEEVPVARWQGDGLVDMRGRVFVHDASDAWGKLPLISGPEGSESDVLSEYQTFSALLARKGLSILQLAVDARGASNLKLNDGIEVRLGREEAELRLQRFADVVLPTLREDLASVAYVDMRYPNGFAVGWSRMNSATCQWQVAPAKRRHMDVAAGRPAMDGSENCTSTCGAAGQRATDDSQGICAATNEVRLND